MEIYIEKVAMIRPLTNPKNCDLDLEMDWSIDYTHKDQNYIGYNCILKSIFLDLNFKIEGILKLEDFEEFKEETSSRIILNNSFDMLMKMFSLTVQSTHNLSGDESECNFGNENVSNALYN
ncbi:pilus assembly protein [Methanobrevibacter sp.]|uniref:pilus assembly protein n=1 Tax=Methanobrevibacter sp. TaxID=66852 RepID=UPI00388F4904